MPPKAFDVLDYLRLNPGRLISQDEILDQVWPNRFVQPEIVKTYIRTLRRLLEDDVRRPRFIETRPRSGYRFVGDLPDRQIRVADGLPSRLMGRDQESAVLDAAFGDAEAGQRGCVIISGDAGLGKSVLLDSFIGAARRRPGVLTAIAYGAPARGTPEPLSLAIALLQNLAQQIDMETLAPALATHAPSWCYYLGLKRSPAPAGKRPSWWPQAMVREACALLEHLAGTTTIVLVLDDLHWADPATIDLLVCLAQRRYSVRLLTLATFRQGDQAGICPVRTALDGVLQQSRAKEITLLPFAVDTDPSLTVPGQCADLSMIMTDRGSIMRLAAASECQRGSDAETRNEGADEFKRSIEAAAPMILSALEAGSIAGPRFCAWAVARILGKDLAGVEDLLSHLAASQRYLLRDGSYTLPDGKRTPIYRFRHPAAYMALLDRQLPAQRRQRFRLLGEVIISFWGDKVKTVADDVSRCFRYAGHWPGVIVFNKLAATSAAEQDRPSDAVRLLTEALDLAWCMDQVCGRVDPSPVWGQATRA